MSGICGGVPSNSIIYDVLISETCHQHDVGKWSDNGFRSEHYDIPLRNTILNQLDALTKSQQIKNSIRDGTSSWRYSRMQDGIFASPNKPSERI